MTLPAPTHPKASRGFRPADFTHRRPGARLTLPAGTMIPLPSTQVAHAQHILMVEFTSPDGRTSKAIGGGDTLDAAIAFAQDSCPTDATWHPISWSDLHGD